VVASTVSQDLEPKLPAYRRNGVREYLVWRVQDAAIDWFILNQGRFERLPPDADGITRSVVFPARSAASSSTNRAIWPESTAFYAMDWPMQLTGISSLGSRQHKCRAEILKHPFFDVIILSPCACGSRNHVTIRKLIPRRAWLVKRDSRGTSFSNKNCGERSTSLGQHGLSQTVKKSIITGEKGD
jgi:hypothetical protein